MRPLALTILAIAWAVLTIAAVLASIGTVTQLGMWAHFIPASAIYSIADALGMRLDPHGAFIRTAHGPPFLGPMGIVVCYVIPTISVAFLAVAASRKKAPELKAKSIGSE